MRFYLLYNDNHDLIGWLSTEHSASIPNSEEVSKEEYLQSGGSISVPPKSEVREESNNLAMTEALLDAILE